jgi:hypothetical protein
LWAMWLAMPGIGLIGTTFSVRNHRKQIIRQAFLVSVILLAVAFQIGCAGFSSNTARQNITGPVTIVASSTNYTHSITITIVQ